jgi:hypothetical protein
MGFKENKVGIHSNESQGVMGMYLAGTPVHSIACFWIDGLPTRVCAMF